MEVTKEEFSQWLEHPVTRSVFRVVADKIEDAKELLSVSAGLQPDSDRFHCGMIQAFRDVLEISYGE